MRKLLYSFLIFSALSACRSNTNVENTTVAKDSLYAELHRPQVHFSPREKWMNDPNGMVFYNDEYHLFYQYYPDSTVWGPMHWGHAISKDLIHWENLPIALYPDSLGYIFSGSAVVDQNNSSGFGSKENPPLVAIYTYHSDEKEKQGRKDYQYQGVAYSTDNGRTWIKYDRNPVLKNQGIPDFRDPKVFWHKETSKWVMILAVKDHVELWNSIDLKSWNKLSDFGLTYGSHGGVWECPDLFELPVQGTNESSWVMLVSINPGGPNGGSATQYFTGKFDGTKFIAAEPETVSNWIDYGPDNYAGVTWSNTGDRKIFIGWMSNWAYAREVPTRSWRSATTLPRDLKLVRTPDGLRIASSIIPEIQSIRGEKKIWKELEVKETVRLNEETDLSKSMLRGVFPNQDFTIILSNTGGEKLLIGYDKSSKRYFIDRSKSGDNDFSTQFNGLAYAQRIANTDKINVTLVTDVSSVEVFFDDGVTVMSSLFFPKSVLSQISISTPGTMKVEDLEVTPLESIW